MKSILYSILGILIPFIGTSLGSSFVFFMKKNMNKNFQKILVGFAAGVMIAASIWSLIIPSVEMAENQHIISWIPASVGFILGIVFLLIINIISNWGNKKQVGITEIEIFDFNNEILYVEIRLFYYYIWITLNFFCVYIN